MKMQQINKFLTIILFLNITCCAHMNKKESIEKQQNVISAENFYENFIKTGDYNQLSKAADSYKTTNIVKAIELYNILKESKIHELHAYESLIFCYIEIDDIKSAKQIANKILSIDATRYKPLSALALVLALSNDHQNALAYFDIALSIYKSPIILNNKALTLALIGKEKEAIDVIDEAALIAKNHQSSITIAMNRALIYGLNNKIDETYNILKPYLNESQIYNNIALYALLKKDTQKARNYLLKALDNDNYYQKAEHNLDVLD